MEDVVLALSNTLGKKGMSEDDIKKLAEYIMSFFGFEGEVIDNRLTSEDRDVFYMLEEEGFLTTTQEEVHLKKGKLWRIHYWILKKDQILRLAKQAKAGIAGPEDESAIYEQMGDDIWKDRKPE
jgi:hypothetical protein